MIEQRALEFAAARLSTLPHFPNGDMAPAVVMLELGKIAHNQERLTWLVDNILAHCSKWCGIAELRALYSTRWKPADGIEGKDCTITGFTPDDNENRYIAEQKQRGLNEAKQRTGKLLSTSAIMPDLP